MQLLVPLDPNRPGGSCETATDGFTVLAFDDRSALVRLDRTFARDDATAGTVFYAALRGGTLRIIRPPNDDDRLLRFRRPAHLDNIVVYCCDFPQRFLGLHHPTSGVGLDLDVSPEEAARSIEDRLTLLFVCESCLSYAELPFDTLAAA